MSRAVLSLGSNLGDRHAHLARAVVALGEAALVVSGVYETDPWSPSVYETDPWSPSVYETDPWSPSVYETDPGSPSHEADADHPEQPSYLNAAVLVADDVPAREWLTRARDIEQTEGRVRDAGWRFGPRTLDIDVIVVWADSGEPVRSADPEFTVPHPRAHLRAFVLRPWLDIQPYAQLPGHGRVADLLRSRSVVSQLPGLRPRPDLVLPIASPEDQQPRRVAFRSNEGE
jgi:2-amino-4-hydroxy-6-hydroxymethyldihydropteridine diphosphokinase